MKFYTVHVCTDGIEKWLVIDQLPAMQEKYMNEVSRQRFTRPGVIVVCILTHVSITWNDAKGLLTQAFDNQSAWITVNLKKPLPDTVQVGQRASR